MTTIPEISVHELEALMNAKADIYILDVRNPDEYALCNLGGNLLPMKELPTRYTELNPDQQIIIHCHAGGRSRRATEFLLQQGFKHVFNLRGGITAWANEIDPEMPKY
jgi:sulfur-carrier protein adenylyltransferase/sulfurtransferase